MSTDEQEISRIHARLDATNSMLTQVRDAVRDVGAAVREQCAVSKERCEACQKELSDHKRTLYGNGRPGLDDRVVALETTFSEKKKMNVGNSSISVRAVVTIIASVSALITALMSQIPAIVQAFTK